MDKINSDNVSFKCATKDEETTHTQVFVLPPELIKELLEKQVPTSSSSIKHETSNKLEAIEKLLPSGIGVANKIERNKTLHNDEKSLITLGENRYLTKQFNKKTYPINSNESNTFTIKINQVQQIIPDRMINKGEQLTGPDKYAIVKDKNYYKDCIEKKKLDTSFKTKCEDQHNVSEKNSNMTIQLISKDVTDDKSDQQLKSSTGEMHTKINEIISHEENDLYEEVEIIVEEIIEYDNDTNDKETSNIKIFDVLEHSDCENDEDLVAESISVTETLSNDQLNNEQSNEKHNNSESILEKCERKTLKVYSNRQKSKSELKSNKYVDKHENHSTSVHKMLECAHTKEILCNQTQNVPLHSKNIRFDLDKSCEKPLTPIIQVLDSDDEKNSKIKSVTNKNDNNKNLHEPTEENQSSSINLITDKQMFGLNMQTKCLNLNTKNNETELKNKLVVNTKKKNSIHIINDKKLSNIHKGQDSHEIQKEIQGNNITAEQKIHEYIKDQTNEKECVNQRQNSNNSPNKNSDTIKENFKLTDSVEIPLIKNINRTEIELMNYKEKLDEFQDSRSFELKTFESNRSSIKSRSPTLLVNNEIIENSSTINNLNTVKVLETKNDYSGCSVDLSIPLHTETVNHNSAVNDIESQNNKVDVHDDTINSNETSFKNYVIDNDEIAISKNEEYKSFLSTDVVNSDNLCIATASNASASFNKRVPDLKRKRGRPPKSSTSEKIEKFTKENVQKTLDNRYSINSQQQKCLDSKSNVIKDESCEIKPTVSETTEKKQLKRKVLETTTQCHKLIKNIDKDTSLNNFISEKNVDNTSIVNNFPTNTVFMKGDLENETDDFHISPEPRRRRYSNISQHSAKQENINAKMNSTIYPLLTPSSNALEALLEKNRQGIEIVSIDTSEHLKLHSIQKKKRERCSESKEINDMDILKKIDTKENLLTQHSNNKNLELVVITGELTKANTVEKTLKNDTIKVQNDSPVKYSELELNGTVMAMDLKPADNNVQPKANAESDNNEYNLKNEASLNDIVKSPKDTKNNTINTNSVKSKGRVRDRKSVLSETSSSTEKINVLVNADTDIDSNVERYTDNESEKKSANSLVEPLVITNTNDTLFTTNNVKKRGRGRPRKLAMLESSTHTQDIDQNVINSIPDINLNKETISTKCNEVEGDTVNNSIESSISKSDFKETKRRGRPRKLVMLESIAPEPHTYGKIINNIPNVDLNEEIKSTMCSESEKETINNSASSNSTKNILKSDDQQPKRRGRPRKSNISEPVAPSVNEEALNNILKPNSYEEIHSNKCHEAEGEAINNPEESSITKSGVNEPKRRGRPRKSVMLEPTAAKEEVDKDILNNSLNTDSNEEVVSKKYNEAEEESFDNPVDSSTSKSDVNETKRPGTPQTSEILRPTASTKEVNEDALNNILKSNSSEEIHANDGHKAEGKSMNNPVESSITKSDINEPKRRGRSRKSVMLEPTVVMEKADRQILNNSLNTDSNEDVVSNKCSETEGESVNNPVNSSISKSGVNEPKRRGRPRKSVMLEPTATKEDIDKEILNNSLNNDSNEDVVFKKCSEAEGESVNNPLDSSISNNLLESDINEIKVRGISRSSEILEPTEAIEENGEVLNNILKSKSYEEVHTNNCHETEGESTNNHENLTITKNPLESRVNETKRRGRPRKSVMLESATAKEEVDKGILNNSLNTNSNEEVVSNKSTEAEGQSISNLVPLSTSKSGVDETKRRGRPRKLGILERTAAAGEVGQKVLNNSLNSNPNEEIVSFKYNEAEGESINNPVEASISCDERVITKRRGRPRRLGASDQKMLDQLTNNLPIKDNKIFENTRKRKRPFTHESISNDISLIKDSSFIENDCNNFSTRSQRSSQDLQTVDDIVGREDLIIESENDSNDNDDESDIHYRKKRKYSLNVRKPRKRGRPKGSQKKLPTDDDYVPHHSYLPRSSKHDLSTLSTLPTTTLKVKKMISCGKCGVELSKSQWSHHNLSVHNDLGWIEGSEKPDFENDEKLLKRILFIAIKKRRGQLTCELCQTVKRSVLGFISHTTFCGKDEETKQALMVTCPVCKAVTKPSSLEYHDRMHKFQEEQKKKLMIDKEYTESGEKVKRKAAEKAVTKISQFSALIKEDIKQQLTKKLKVDSPIMKKLIKRPQLTKPIGNMIIWKWNQKLNSGENARCSQPGCNFTSNSLDEIKEHYLTCNFTPRKTYMCKVCQFQSLSEQEIVDHVVKNHSQDDKDDANVSISDEESYSSDNVEEVGNINKIKNNNSAPKILLKETNDSSYQMFKFLFRKDNGPNEYHAVTTTFQWTLEFERRNYNFYLFEEYTPNSFQLINLNTAKQYLPELEESMSVKNVKFTSSSFLETRWKKWKRFEGQCVQDNPTFFVGGPVWALAWLPIPSLLSFSKNISQFIAVSTHPTMDIEYTIGQAYAGKNIIQIWNLGELDHKVSANRNPELAYAIAHEGGTVWCLDWCPSGCYQHPDLPGYSNENNGLKRIGLLAAACSDGCIRIYSLIFPEDLPSRESNENRYPIYNTEPVMILVVNTRMYDKNEQNHQVTKLSWSKDKQHNVIVAGFSNGYVALWDLKAKSSMLRSNRGDIVYLNAYRHFLAHFHAVTMVYLIPQDNKRFLATASLDRHYKFWDLEDVTNPKNTMKKSFVTDGSWLNNWNTAILAYDDALSMNHSYINCLPLREYTYKYYNILPTNSTSYAISTSDFGNSIANGTLAGEVLAIFPQQLLYIRDMEKTLPRKQYTSMVSSVEIVDFHENEEKSEESNNINSELNNCELEYNYKPSTYKDSKDRFGLKFYDKMSYFRDERLQRGPKNYKKKFTCEMMESVPIEQYPFMSANQVSWNPNARSFLWLAAGYQNGFVRLIQFKSVALTNEWKSLLRSHIDLLQSEITKPETPATDMS